MNSDNLQRAYNIATSIMDSDWQNFRRIPVEKAEARYEIKPLEKWMAENENGCAAYAYNRYSRRDPIVVLIAQNAGHGNECPERLYEAVFFPTRLSGIQNIDNETDVKRYFGKKKNLREQSPSLVDVRTVYEERILPQLAKLAPAVQELDNIAFEKIIREYGGFSDTLTGPTFGWLDVMKELNFDSLDEVVKEIEKLPGILDEYRYWTNVI